MNVCTYEYWTLKDVSQALENRQKEGRIIKVPLFQRSIVWKDEQSKMFIDSLRKGFPIGTLLFAKSVQDSQEIFTLIDGLQRSNTIKSYIQNPTRYFGSLDIDDKLISDINSLLGLTGNQEDILRKIKSCLIEFITKSKDISEIEGFDFALALSKEFPILNDDIGRLKSVREIVTPFIKEYKKNYSDICEAKIPVIIYSGDEKYLPDIFARINNQGTALTKYQIFAASWSIEGKITVNHPKIVESILKKYDKMIDEGFELQDYDRDELSKTKQFSIFEYVFGFGKYICDEFPHLFEKDKKVEEINPIGFELLNACFGKSSDEIKNLYLHIKDVDIAKFESCVIQTIKWIDSILKPYTAFVGNKRSTAIFHAKNQMISIIASTFLEQYTVNNLEISKKSWKETKKLLERNIPLHYVYDILSQEWGDGGVGKIYTILNNNKYLQSISKQSWDAMLDNWFANQLNRQEAKNVATPKLSDLLFLNCIYNDIFSAKDQLSKKFDVEHIVTKNFMRTIIRKNAWQGQPISCIANLCYLPEQINRAKKDNNFYQDKSYLQKFPLSYIEQKFSFTKASDLEWTTLPFDIDDYNYFAEEYVSFLKGRFKIQKQKFFESMEI